MRTTLTILMTLCLVAGIAVGKDLVKKDIPSRVMIDCATATPIVCGDVVAGDNTGLANNFDEYGCGYSNESGPEVFYTFTLDECATVYAALSDMNADLDIFMGICGQDVDCFFSGNVSFTTSVLEPGDYYLVVDGYNGAESSYTLTLECTPVECPLDPPDNDVCTGAIDLQVQGLAQFDVDLAAGGYTNAESMGYGGCTGYSTDGPEAFYKIYLEADESFSVTEDGECDMAMYLFTDCEDPFASCVAGSDNTGQEIISYTATEAGWYYLGVDAYASAGCLVTVTIDAPVANDDMGWGSVKSLYR